MRRLHLCLLLILGAVAMRMAAAQPAASSQSPVRYHYGDNPAWANPAFDDSSWPADPDGAWQIAPFHSDGIVWVRFRVPVSADPAAGASLWLVNPHAAAGEVFLDGKLIGQSGGLPPKPRGVVLPAFSVLDAPGIPRKASFATVALRLWYLPSYRYRGGEDRATCELDSAAVLKERLQAQHVSNILSWVPFLSLNGMLMLLGLGLLGLWRWSGRRELFWFALLLVFFPLLPVTVSLPALAGSPINVWLWDCVLSVANLAAMFMTVKFLWIIFDLRSRPLSIVLHTCWIVYIAAGSLTSITTAASPAFACMMPLSIVSVTAFNLVTLLIDLRYLVTGPNRAFAAAMAVIPIASSLSIVGLNPTDLFGIPHLDLFSAGVLVVGVFLSVMLARRAFDQWRVGTRLRIEFSAAREVQQRLVPAALPHIDRFNLEAAYLPAQEVGGDFYQVLPLRDGSTLIVIGDVSGKGLKAAMTGTLALGALRTLAQEALSPAQILFRLNAQLAASSDGGFITCICVRIAADGALTIANAGHLAPYRNGEELSVDNGLPLGIAPDAAYSESVFQLAPGDRLTFLSDGVVEAQSPTGELYGFDRTAAISTQTAEQIAAAAQAFGQEDDITVLTLRFVPSELMA